MFALLSVLMLAGSAGATDVLEAERIRLSDEMRKMAERQAWLGVEHCMDTMEARGMTIPFADRVRAAHAARALGDLSLAYERLKVASAMQEDRAVIEQLYEFDTRYGRVMLSGPGKPVLAIAELPFDPDARRAVEAAVESVAQKGAFAGLLPAGRYTFGGQSFDVAPGATVTLALPGPGRRGKAPRGS